MTPNEYQKLALRTEKTPTFINPEHEDDSAAYNLAHQKARLLHGMIGVCTEAGELQDQIKKHLIYGKPLDLTNVMEEVGDVLWYLALTLDAAGFTMEQAMERNIQKLKARYPEGFTEEAALERKNLEGERKALENFYGIKAAEEAVRSGHFPQDGDPMDAESVKSLYEGACRAREILLAGLNLYEETPSKGAMRDALEALGVPRGEQP